MANVFAIHSAVSSIAKFLDDTYQQALETVAGSGMPRCKFELVSSSDLAAEPEETARITLYLYRTTVNEHTRQARPGNALQAEITSLGLDLHFLLSAWGSTATDELVTLAWAMRQLHLNPFLDGPSMTPEANWGGDQIKIVRAELSTEDVMRIWDALDSAYRLSVPYIARVVRLDPDTPDEGRAVVASRYAYGVEAPK